VRHPQISGAERFAFHADLVIEVPFSVSQDMAGRDAHSGERKLALPVKPHIRFRRIRSCWALRFRRRSVRATSAGQLHGDRSISDLVLGPTDCLLNRHAFWHAVVVLRDNVSHRPLCKITTGLAHVALMLAARKKERSTS
jgi:hypothetical protein